MNAKIADGIVTNALQIKPVQNVLKDTCSPMIPAPNATTIIVISAKLILAASSALKDTISINSNV